MLLSRVFHGQIEEKFFGIPMEEWRQIWAMASPCTWYKFERALLSPGSTSVATCVDGCVHEEKLLARLVKERVVEGAHRAVEATRHGIRGDAIAPH